MKAFLTLFFVIGSVACAFASVEVSRFPSGLDVGSVVSSHIDPYGTVVTSVVVGGIIATDPHPEISITAADGSELLNWEATMNLATATVATFFYNYNGVNALQYVKFSLVGTSGTSTIWYPTYVVIAAEPTADPITVQPLTAASFMAFVMTPAEIPPETVSLESIKADTEAIKLLVEAGGSPLDVPGSIASQALPVALQGQIKPSDFAFASGLTGILCAFTIIMLWSRGL